MSNAQMILFSNDSLESYRIRIDTSVVSSESRWNAVNLVVGTNLTVWGFDRFVVNTEFSKIRASTIKANFRNAFVWDNDFFSTNLFLHPYHGAQYFNAARINGNTYWQSLPYTLGGSLMWEMFMENEYPSINDLIATTFGGANIGEVTFRLCDHIIDNRAWGWQRFGRETAAFLVSPVRGVNRILSGQSWKHQQSKGNIMPPLPLNGYAALGFRSLYDDGQQHDERSSLLTLHAGFSYGNPYDEDNDRPYDYYSAQLYANLFSNQPIIGRVKTLGMLYSNHLQLKKKYGELSWGIFQHFNYFETTSDTNRVKINPYKLSEAASVGPGLLYKKKFGKNSYLYASFYLSGILLGSSQSDHYRVEDRDYNLGSGFSTKLNLEWAFKERLAIRVNSEDYRIYTWMGSDPNYPHVGYRSSQGDRSNASLSLGTLNIDYRFCKSMFVGLESSYFYRMTLYKHFPTVEHGVVDNCVRMGLIL